MLKLDWLYAIGQCDPIGIHVDLEGHSAYTNEYVTHMLQQLVSCQPQTMIDRLQLNQVRYQDTAVLGHVGRFASDKPWEALDLVDQMRDYVCKLGMTHGTNSIISWYI